jgi:hypothetical protein
LLSASLLFCWQKSRNTPDGVSATDTGSIGRDDKGRHRLVGLDVALTLSGIPKTDRDWSVVSACSRTAAS